MESRLPRRLISFLKCTRSATTVGCLAREHVSGIPRTLDFGSGWTAVSLVGTIIAMAKDQTRKARAAGVVSVGRNGRCARAVDGWVQAMD